MRSSAAVSVFLGVVGLPVAALADVVVNTGDASGSYHGAFCPVLVERLEQAGVAGACATSNGTTDNMDRVRENPAQLGYGQLDVLALDAARSRGTQHFERVRVDDVRECIFAVSANPEITNFGEVAVRADQLRFILPPKTSGSAATFRYLQKIDPYGLGRAETVLHAGDTEEAIRLAMADTSAIAIFVQFPDPENKRFKLIEAGGGHIVPVIDRNILGQQLEGRAVYAAQETQVANARWLKSGTRVVTACTPLVLFTGKPDSLPEGSAREEHDRLIAMVRGWPAAELMPKESLFARVLKRTKELTSVSAAQFVELSEKAREKAAPLFEKARDAARKAVDAARPEGAGTAAEGEAGAAVTGEGADPGK